MPQILIVLVTNKCDDEWYYVHVHVYEQIMSSLGFIPPQWQTNRRGCVSYSSADTTYMYMYMYVQATVGLLACSLASLLSKFLWSSFHHDLYM